MVSAQSVPSQDALAAASVYVSVFAGRDDAYSFWTGDHWRVAGDYEQVEGGGWRLAQRYDLTPEKVVEAFVTGVPISSYLLDEDGTTNMAALDIDRDDGEQLGKSFLRHVVRLGGIGYLEPSRRGCHVWVPLSNRLPAIVVRRGLRALCKEAGLPQDPKREGEWRPEPHIELRPGSDRIREGGIGHCIRMPTMPHQRTGKRYALINAGTGEKLPGKLTGMMLEIDSCPVSIITDAAERAPLPPITSQPMELRYPLGQPENIESASHILITLWHADPRAAPGKLITCPAHDDQRPSLSILRDDERAICRSPSCILNNDDNGRGLYELRTMAPRPAA